MVPRSATSTAPSTSGGEVISTIADSQQIAFQLGVSEATIKAHVSAILQKLHVDSRTQAVIAINRIEGDWRSPKA